MPCRTTATGAAAARRAATAALPIGSVCARTASGLNDRAARSIAGLMRDMNNLLERARR